MNQVYLKYSSKTFNCKLCSSKHTIQMVSSTEIFILFVIDKRMVQGGNADAKKLEMHKGMQRHIAATCISRMSLNLTYLGSEDVVESLDKAHQHLSSLSEHLNEVIAKQSIMMCRIKDLTNYGGIVNHIFDLLTSVNSSLIVSRASTI